MNSMNRLPASSKPGFDNQYWANRQVRVEPDVTAADLLRPNFWVHHAETVSVGDKITVQATDSKLYAGLYAELLVVEKGPGYVKMRMLLLSEDAGTHSTPEPVDLPELPPNYKVVFAPKSGWVTRTVEPSMTVATSKNKQDAYAAALVHARKSQGIAA